MSSILTDFILERIGEQPVAQRIMLYRAFACETKDRALAAGCRRMADDLEAIEVRHQQLLLDFKRRQIA